MLNSSVGTRVVAWISRVVERTVRSGEETVYVTVCDDWGGICGIEFNILI